MNAIDMLKTQHREAEALFEKLEKGPSRDRLPLLTELAKKLTGHMEIEEQLFYPAAYEVDTDEAEHAAEEHEEAKPLLDKLMRLEGDSPEFSATLRELKEKIQHHVEEEESELFPECERKLGAEELETLGEEMAQLLVAVESGAVKSGEDDTSVIAPI